MEHKTLCVLHAMFTNSLLRPFLIYSPSKKRLEEQFFTNNLRKDGMLWPVLNPFINTNRPVPVFIFSYRLGLAVRWMDGWQYYAAASLFYVFSSVGEKRSFCLLLYYTHTTHRCSFFSLCRHLLYQGENKSMCNR